MAKTKRKGGLSGIARFVFDSMNSDVAKPDVQDPSSSNIDKSNPNLTVPEVQMKNTDGGHEDRPAQKELEQEASGTPRPSKRRKKNDAGPSTVVDRWVEKYDASGLVPHYTHASQVPEHMQKYFAQRHRFFSLYSEPPGCLLDEEGWYSVTPELLADQIAERCRCDTILDAFCGVGGNSIAFAKTCQRVIALDTSPTRLALARHNAQIYGVADRIEFILADYITFAKSYLSLPTCNSPQSRKIDVVFLSPPWGGPAYLSGSLDEKPTDAEDENKASAPAAIPTPAHPSYSLSSIQPIHGAELFDLTRKITRNVAYYLPRNTRLEEISNLLLQEEVRSKRPPGQTGHAGSGAGGQPSPAVAEKVEVEEEWMGNKLKALTCYFGGLAQGQEHLF
ncbi:S-adenosyl-L-methionine-dependent methyltransferase [Agrocybe pediades]|nr:S-adenosyl-L-methionine-dependent methyltransferase [Agrocybe pediades]